MCVAVYGAVRDAMCDAVRLRCVLQYVMGVAMCVAVYDAVRDAMCDAVRLQCVLQYEMGVAVCVAVCDAVCISNFKPPGC